MIEKWFYTAAGLIDESLLVIDFDSRILYLNSTAEEFLGYSEKKARNKKIQDLITLKYEEGRPFNFNLILQSVSSGNPVKYKDLVAISQNREVVSVEIKAESIEPADGSTPKILLVIKDISSEKKSYDLLLKSENHYRMLIENISDLISIISTDGFILYTSPAVEQLLGYRVEELIGERAVNLIHPDDYSVILDKYNNDWKDSDALIKHECRLSRKDGTWRNFESIGTKIYNAKGRLSSIVLNSRDITERKTAEEEISKYRYHLEDLVNERTERLEDANRRLQSEIEMRMNIDDELQKSVLKLRMTLSGTVQAIASTVEARDLYTAGHQRRVAQLSEAIAKEMGLSEDRVESIQMAGVVHDLGKIYIPSEILTRPGKLTDEEFNLIKIHPTVGYNILSTIDFPWPLGQIVFQHHERLDGSGYPQGLKGDDILLESRIIAVADVVEAMSNHRPYRPSLGLDTALQEIQDRRGIQYDPDISDICRDLFLNRGFVFK